MPVDDRMTTLALSRAKEHVYNVCQTGATIILSMPGTTDEFGEMLTTSTLTLNAFPVRYKPYDRDIIEKVGWAENTDAIFYVAKKQIDDLSLTIDYIKQYIKIRHENKEYDISHIERFSSFGTDCLYVLIGVKI